MALMRMGACDSVGWGEERRSAAGEERGTCTWEEATLYVRLARGVRSSGCVGCVMCLSAGTAQSGERSRICVGWVPFQSGCVGMVL